MNIREYTEREFMKLDEMPVKRHIMRPKMKPGEKRCIYKINGVCHRIMVDSFGEECNSISNCNGFMEV